MVDNGTSETATEMTPSTLEVIDDKPSISSEEVVTTTTNTESSKKKKKKKKDSASLAKIDTTEGKKDDEEKENGTSNGKEKDTTKTTEKDSSDDKEKKSTDGVLGKEKEKKKVQSSAGDPSSGPVISATKRTRPPYKFNAEKITLRFLFANKDGFTITIECKPDTTVGEVKGRLLSVWPEDLDSCTNGDQLRLICMGKGVLMPDTRTLEDCDVPVFKTHPTPINVAVRPKAKVVENSKSGGKDGSGARGGSSSGGGGSAGRSTEETGQGCGCVIS